MISFQSTIALKWLFRHALHHQTKLSYKSLSHHPFTTSVWCGQKKKNEQSNQFIHKKEEEEEQEPDHRCISKTSDEFQQQRQQPIQQPDYPRLNRVAMIGEPNAGKSTLVNDLVGFSISSVSSKIHTTRSNIIGIFVQDNVQVELTDTPGFVMPKHIIRHKLEPTFLRDPLLSSTYSNLLAVVVDVSNKRNVRIRRGILNLLYKHREKPSILILNKIDLLKTKQKLIDFSNLLTNGGRIMGRNVDSLQRLDFKLEDRYLNAILDKTEQKQQQLQQSQQITHLTSDYFDSIEPIQEYQEGWSHFSKVFMVSALTGDGVEDLRKYLIDSAVDQNWLHNRLMASNRSPKKLVIDIIKGKVLDNLDSEIPYILEYDLEEWEMTTEGDLKIYIAIKCPKPFYISKVIGLKGSKISKIVNESIVDLSGLFKCKVDLKLVVEPMFEKFAKNKKGKST